jgi:cadmium resistance protein CadD (predicted permease)
MLGGIFFAVLAAGGLFAFTNADDIVVLTALNATSRTGGRPTGRQIWLGQYAGFTVLVLGSLAGAAGLTLVPVQWLRLLGLVPLGFGLYKLAEAIRTRRSGQDASPAIATGLTGVAGLTIMNGTDNISVYTPVFRTSSLAGALLIIIVFMAGTAVYCLAGSLFAAYRPVTRVIKRWGQWIVPFVFIVLGVYILGKTGALTAIRV